MLVSVLRFPESNSLEATGYVSFSFLSMQKLFVVNASPVCLKIVFQQTTLLAGFKHKLVTCMPILS
jgi:hypothetical protein